MQEQTGIRGKSTLIKIEHTSYMEAPYELMTSCSALLWNSHFCLFQAQASASAQMKVEQARAVARAPVRRRQAWTDGRGRGRTDERAIPPHFLRRPIRTPAAAPAHLFSTLPSFPPPSLLPSVSPIISKVHPLQRRNNTPRRYIIRACLTFRHSELAQHNAAATEH